MRLLGLLLICHLISFSIIGQVNYDLESGLLLDTLPHVRGSITHYSKSYNKDLYINYTIVSPEFRNIVQKTAPIAEDGTFTLVVDKKIPNQKIILNIGDYYKGYLIACHDVEIVVDLNTVVKNKESYAGKAIEFRGTDGEMNQFYNVYQEYKLAKKQDVRRRKFSTLMNRTSQTEFKIRQLRELFEELEKIDKAFCKKYGRKHKWILDNERASEMYGDLAFIFMGRRMGKELWQECLQHKPLLVTELSNRYYGILALKLWSHEEKEVRALSRLIYNGDSDSPNEKKEVDEFLNEQDKKNAGLSYNNEIYSKGLEKFTAKYREQVADAKLDLYISKLSKVPSEKIGLIGIKGQPLEVADRQAYLDRFLTVVKDDWQSSLIESEYADYQEWIENLSMQMKSSFVQGSDRSLGTLVTHMASGAGAWTSKATSVKLLLKQIRNYYKGKALIIYIWDTSCTPCVEELTKAGRTYDKLIDEPIELVTLALNKSGTQSDWEASLLQTYALGEHVFLSKKLSSEIVEYFQLSPLPAYLYFDEESRFSPNKIFAIDELDVKELLEE